MQSGRNLSDSSDSDDDDTLLSSLGAKRTVSAIIRPVGSPTASPPTITYSYLDALVPTLLASLVKMFETSQQERWPPIAQQLYSRSYVLVIHIKNMMAAIVAAKSVILSCRKKDDPGLYIDGVLDIHVQLMRMRYFLQDGNPLIRLHRARCANRASFKHLFDSAFKGYGTWCEGSIKRRWKKETGRPWKPLRLDYFILEMQHHFDDVFNAIEHLKTFGFQPYVIELARHRVKDEGFMIAKCPFRRAVVASSIEVKKESDAPSIVMRDWGVDEWKAFFQSKTKPLQYKVGSTLMVSGPTSVHGNQLVTPTPILVKKKKAKAAGKFLPSSAKSSQKKVSFASGHTRTVVKASKVNLFSGGKSTTKTPKVVVTRDGKKINNLYRSC